MRVALLFTDGVGVGVRDPAKNPLAKGDFLLSHFKDEPAPPLPFGGVRALLDTTFGVEGRPQSASNQTALYTGLAAPKLCGEHILGYPDERLAALLAEHSIVKRLLAAGRSATFANGYPKGYLTALGLPHDETAPADITIPDDALRWLKPSASTLSFSAAKVKLRSFADIHRGLAITHDVDGAGAAKRGMVLPLRTADQAAEIFWRVAHDYTLFEHYLADEAGHHRDEPAALEALGKFDAFARAVLERRPADAQVLIVSDHGNVEDLSTRSHTRNDVALLSFGPEPLPEVKNLAEVGQLVLRWLGAQG
ncbi:MAG: metalloenzyme [Myxococcaceae bacterium]